MKKHLFLKSLLVLIGVLITSFTTQVWAGNSQRIIFFQPSSEWKQASAYFDVHYWQYSNSSNNGDVRMTESNNSGVYYAFIPDWADRVQFVRRNPSGGGEWNRTSDQTVQNWYGQCNITGWTSSYSWDNTVWWNTYTVYYDDYETNFKSGVSTPKLRVGTTDKTTADNMTLVTGTKSLYKKTKTDSNWDGYHAFCFAQNYGKTGNSGASIYDRGSGDYTITNQTEYIRGSLKGDFTFIGRSADSYTSDGCKYYKTEIYYGKKTYRITNSSVSNGSLTLTYVDESGTTRTVGAGSYADVLPTTIVTVTATPSSGFSLTNVKLTDAAGSNRDWTANGSESNQYIVRSDVTFKGVFETKASKTFLVKDDYGWGSMSMHAWNLFTGTNTIDYPIMDAITVTNAGGCNGTWYVVNISNEYYYCELYKSGDISANAGDVQTKNLTGTKYLNTNAGGYTLTTSNCTLPTLYYVETYDGTNLYRSNVVKSTSDTMSFYANLQNISAYVKIRKCTNGSWSTSSDLKSSFSSSYTPSANEPGNIFIAKTNAEGNALSDIAVYNGKTYIRTDVAGGWDDYKHDADTMVFNTEYRAATNNQYSHYYMHWVTTAYNIKFDLANQYNAHLSGRDEGYAADDNTDDAGKLAHSSNVRFMWNRYTNTLSRAYISGSTEAGDRYLVLSCSDNKIKDKDGNAFNISGLNPNEALFADDGNWVYELDAKVYPGAQIKLTSDVILESGERRTQYFKGTSSSYVTLMSGSVTEYQSVRIVYDFKTNHLVAAWVPNDAAISSTFTLNTDVMLLRKHQGEAKQIYFSGAGISLKEVRVLNNKSEAAGHANLTGTDIKSASYRNLYWISFPFDVNLDEVFGFGTYGTHWIIEYYDGKGRAKNGFWSDSDPNWKFVTPAEMSSFVLKADMGYVLALDLDRLGTGSDIWNLGVENVYLYFPSTTTIGDLTRTTHTVTFEDQSDYECKINRPTADGNRTIKDSYWHCIGVPSFANNSEGVTTDGSSVITWSSEDMPFLYQWNAYSHPYANTLTPQNTNKFNFKAMYAYLCQYSGAEMHWSAVTNVTPAAIVAKKTSRKDFNLQLDIWKGESKEDHALMRITDDENVTENFEFNYDLCKEYNSGKANIWTLTADALPVAGNSIPYSETKTIVPVGVKIAANGEYTFTIPEGTDGVGVVLIDNISETNTNLSVTDYTVNLEAGTYNDRFSLEISPIAYIPTGIDLINGENGANGVRKVMCDGVLYIVKDGEVFDARGSRVK